MGSVHYIQVRRRSDAPKAAERALLARRLHELQYNASFSYRRLERARIGAPVLLNLRFGGRASIDELTAAFFWARVIPMNGSGWIIRPTALDPDHQELLVEPLPDEIDLLCAETWYECDHGENPLVEICLGFRHMNPFPTLRFGPREHHLH
jgi:hypothetical protein